MEIKPEKDTSMSLSDKVYYKVKQLIIEGQLQPGEQVRQIQLAGELKVSRTPLINALQRLVSENYVEYHPQRGYTVRKFTRDEMLQLHRIREACEGVAAHDACQRITDEQIAELRALFEPFLTVSVWSPEVMKQYLQADMEFHQRLIEISGNPFLMQALNNLGIFYFTYQWGLLQDPQASIKDHLAIIEHLSARDHDAARNAMEKHLMKSRDNVVHFF
ncbi:MAG: GntR family transcriptional regulator [Firmicutes bacterium]|nr:GntR family transcriptional regulator [Bacillota bacterium]